MGPLKEKPFLTSKEPSSWADRTYILKQLNKSSFIHLDRHNINLCIYTLLVLLAKTKEYFKKEAIFCLISAVKIRLPMGVLFEKSIC
jgi:hypothetical protein